MATSNDYRTKVIELTVAEDRLRSLLLDVAEWIDSSSPDLSTEGQTRPPPALQHEKIVLRFTGGWVRDKLLGIASHDIDVAINTMTGYQFGMKMKEFLEIPGNGEKYGIEKSKGAGGLHKIEANPEKSKHLETVTTNILGFDVDLVNLRKETYSEDSRNPQMEFGTPEEDAFRRDATVNALFYNLNKGEVEDFTGQGFDDMAKKIIRTPLEPYQTFKDDPLRVLRLIRFATRLDYMIDPAAQESMRNKDIRVALRSKISRERVGIELEKMLRGRDPRAALQYIDKLDLYDTIFTDPAAPTGFVPEVERWGTIYDYTQSLIDKASMGDTPWVSQLLPTVEDQYQVWVSTALIPWMDAPLPPPPKKNRAPIPSVITVAQEGFKAPNKVLNVLASSIQNLDGIRQMIDRFNTHQKFPNKRKEGSDATARDVIGMQIRKWGPSWRQQLIFAMLYEIWQGQTALQAIEDSYEKFVLYVTGLDLMSAYDIKPLIDGKTLSKTLSIPPGPWMKDALDVVVAWQLRNPDVQDPTLAIEDVRNKLRENDANAGRDDTPGSKKDKALRSTDLRLASTLRTHFLREVVKPLFARGQLHPSLTPEGRQKLNPKQREHLLISEEEAQTPWKCDPYVFPVLHWVLASLTPSSVESNWPLLVPPILAIIDDHEIKFKVQGCKFLQTLLEKTSPNLLKRTGLAGVFDEAVFPGLSYLPKLTPIEESVQMLDAAYPCLVQLIRTRYPVESRDQDPETWDAKVKAITKLIRHGVFNGMMLAGEYPPIATCLITHLSALISEEGIDSVRHLKEDIPLLSNILGDPFALAHPPLLLAATSATQSAILNGWPRMDGWKAEILKGVCFLWVRIMEESRDKEEEIRNLMARLKETVRMLNAALKKSGKVGLSEDLDAIISADAKLAGLFKGIELVS